MANVTQEQVIRQLKQVHDPEIPVDVYNFGLIYGIEISDGDYVKITMTLSSEACPAAQMIPSEIIRKVEMIENVKCTVEVVWEPRWTPELITAEGRRLLGLDHPDG